MRLLQSLFRYQGILVNQLVAWKRWGLALETFLLSAKLFLTKRVKRFASEGSFVEAGYCRKIWGKRGADSGSVEGGYGVGMWKVIRSG